MWNAQIQWDNSIQGAWSLAAIGLVTGLLSSIIIEKPNDEGYYQVVKIVVLLYPWTTEIYCSQKSEEE